MTKEFVYDALVVNNILTIKAVRPEYFVDEKTKHVFLPNKEDMCDLKQAMNSWLKFKSKTALNTCKYFLKFNNRF